MPTYRLTDKIRILRNTQASNDFEPTPEQLEEVHSAWADLRPLNAAEQLNAQQLGAVATHRCIIRQPYCQIDSMMRIESARGILEVVGVTDVDGRGDYIELLCKQGIPHGH